MSLASRVRDAIRGRWPQQIDGDTEGTSFQISFNFSFEAGEGASLGGMTYFVRDPGQRKWGKFAGTFISGGFGSLPASVSLPAPENERWVSFQSDRPARVLDFWGQFAAWGYDATHVGDVVGRGNIIDQEGLSSRFWMAHPLFPYTAGVSVNGRTNIPDFLGWSPFVHSMVLPTGQGISLGASVSRGGAIPIAWGSDDHPPYTGYAPP
jgi:hypothetical protein